VTDISLETVAGKLNRLGYDAFMMALRQAKLAGNRNLELAHWLAQVIIADRSDLVRTLDVFKIDRARVAGDIAKAVGALRKNETEMPGVAQTMVDLLDRGWHYATLFFGEPQIRTGHLLLAAFKSLDLRRALLAVSPQFGKINADTLASEYTKIWAGSDEESMRPIDGSGVAPAGAGGAAEGPKGQTALGRFAQNLTEKAAAGGMDPVLGRDDEIRQLIDVLMRRRQNNPILTGEAGVGKTAVVEGFAQRIAGGDVPPALRGVQLHVLDVGLMQAGASMKGEFEQRLRSVIDEVQNSPVPIILFIDEAHTLIGAGGQAGTGDAANLLKPALARGTLRTIAATTWAEYRQYIEKDPALTRRFQPLHVGEPDLPTASAMLRGLIAPMETHHKVKVADSAVVAAVSMSMRYIPARQLPDKAVSLLDTACARVAISQTTTPAGIEDLRAAIANLATERAALVSDQDLGAQTHARIAAIDTEIATLEARKAELEAEWAKEDALVKEILDLRLKLANERQGAQIAADDEHSSAPLDPDAIRARIKERLAGLDAISPDRRAVYPVVDEQAVAAVVSDWTGIPVGRMVADEVEIILNLPSVLNQRVVGQSHGLTMIAKRIQTNRAKLDNPDKPIGVFMLCGPSGVGKTETALTLAEALYGGEQNIITINMSEFQEAHTVSTLKGAPPGYVGYGEGGRLTEAVRRRPYSVVLLDEVEKAHPDVHELFFQVFDKGAMEDGTGRRIDFRNTLIILTSNVGTDTIMMLACDPAYASDGEALAQALKPDLLKVFPPALLGRIVTIPYLPLSPDMLGGIVKLNLSRIGRRLQENHKASFSYDDAVIEAIVSRCNDPASGGRMIDNIVTNTILPALSRGILSRQLAQQPVTGASVSVKDGEFVCEIR
jgi:type VI secretion system protein VasG